MKSVRKASGVPAAVPPLPRGDSAEASSAFATLSAASAGVGCAHTAPGAAAQPTVTLQRDGERVTLIRIECACGQVVELDCAY